MLMVSRVYLCVQVEKVQISAFDPLLLLLSGLEQIALQELAVEIGLYGGADNALAVLVPPQLLLYLHLDLLKYPQLAVMGGRLLAFFAANVDVVADCLVGYCASIAEEGATVGKQLGRSRYQLRQLIFHLLVCQFGTLYTVLLLQETTHAH